MSKASVRRSVFAITAILVLVLVGLREFVIDPVDGDLYKNAARGGAADEGLIVQKLILDPLVGEGPTTAKPKRRKGNDEEEAEEGKKKPDADQADPEPEAEQVKPNKGQRAEGTREEENDQQAREEEGGPVTCATTPLEALDHMQTLVKKEHTSGLEDKVSPNQCRRHFDDVMTRLGSTTHKGTYKDSHPPSSHCTIENRRLLKPTRSSACAPAGIGATAAGGDDGEADQDQVGNTEKGLPDKPPLPLNFFIDLGSRTIDQTTGFALRYPRADTYIVHCFEANPSFNKLYPPFVAKNAANGRSSDTSSSSRYKLLEMYYHNEAAGVMNTTLFLSDRSVGSSIVSEKKKGPKPGGAKETGVHVPVTSLSRFLAEEVGGRLGQALLHPSCLKKVHSSHVVLKMDIEKMEFAVLNQMIRTGTLALVDDLLLECHYNTNKPKSQRNLETDLGKDDCRDLVSQLNSYFASSPETRPFITVLWNSVKTAKSSRYSEQHGGFFPT